MKGYIVALVWWCGFGAAAALWGMNHGMWWPRWVYEVSLVASIIMPFIVWAFTPKPTSSE
jgi:hypothetical protein